MTAEIGKKVKVHYTGKLSDGTIFDDSYNDEPLEFVIGNASLLPIFENEVIGMKVGEKKSFEISAKDAYGYWTEELILEFKKENLPDDVDFQIGDVMQLQLNPEQIVSMKVLENKDKSVVFDANHKLAGQDLIFDIELMSID